VFEGHTDYVSSVTISPDGRWGLSGTREYMATNDHTLRLWDLATGQCVRTFEEHKGSVGSVSISPDGRWVLSSSSSDQTLRLWGCLATGPTAPFAVTRPRSAVEAGRVAAQAAQAIDRARGLLGRGLAQEAVEVLIGVRQQAEYERHPVVLGLLREAGLSGTRIALAVGWCVRSLDGHTGLVHSVAISPDGCRALSGSTDKTLRLWDLATGKCLHTLKARDFMWMPSVRISPDGRWGLSGSWDERLRLWDLAEGKCVRVFEGHSGDVHSVAISPDGRGGLSGSKDKTLRLWNLATGQCVRVFEGHTERVNAVAIGPDGRWALSGSSDQTLRLWDLATGQCVRVFEGHGGSVRAVAISPDRRWGLSGAGLSDVSDDEEHQLARGDEAMRRMTALLEQGDLGAAEAFGKRFLADKFRDNSLRLWELTTGKCVRVLEGHTDWVNSVTISPDGSWGLSGSNDKTLRLWELATGQCVRVFEGHTEAVNSVAMSPDGSWVLSGSNDSTVRLWELAWDYGFPEPADWDAAAEPHLASFLALHPPRRSLLRRLVPTWSEGELQRLLTDLRYRGFGWLRPEGVRRELEKMTREWKGLPDLPWESGGVKK
jgi:WD40 repeat protein